MSDPEPLTAIQFLGDEMLPRIPEMARSDSQVGAKPVTLRCPHCGNLGTFAALETSTSEIRKDNTVALFSMGARFCPNETCGSPVLFITNRSDAIFAFPRPRLPFDSSNLPLAVASCMAEAVTCYAEGCYRASALMVRRSLEELCKDRQATGGNLVARIKSLKGKITVPTELLDAADELRLLGNDAAHVEAKQYDDIGAEEVEIAIQLTQELVKAVYQHEKLLGRLRDLKKNQTP